MTDILTFGPDPTRLKGTRILAWLLIATGVSVAAFILLSAGTAPLAFGGAAMALATLAGGGYYLLHWSRKLAAMQARFTPATLELTAPSGLRLGGNGPLLTASIPWTAVEAVRLLEIPTVEGVPAHQVCFLYSTHGDFSFHALHWERHPELIAALIERSGRAPGQPLPPRPGVESFYSPGERMLFGVLRVLGWAGLAASALFFWFLVERLWTNGLNWTDLAMLPVFLTFLGGSYALIRLPGRHR